MTLALRRSPLAGLVLVFAVAAVACGSDGATAGDAAVADAAAGDAGGQDGADAGPYVEGDGHCVRPVGACEFGGDGTSWACATQAGGPGALLGLPEELVRGDRYYIASGAYASYTFDDPTDGAAEIIVTKAVASAHGPADGWSDALADGPATWGPLHFATSYYVFDGITGGGAASFRAGHGFRLEVDDPTSGFISTSETLDHIRIRHTELTHIGDTQVIPSGDAFKNAGTLDDFEFSYNYVHHLSGLALFMRGGQRWLIEHNYVDDVCGSSLQDVDWHCEHLVVHGADDVTVRYNMLLGGRSTGILVNNDLESVGWKIYGNVFDNDGGSAILSVAADPADHSRTFVVVNNVFMGDSGAKLIMDNDDHVIFNNIFFDTASVASLPATHDYNYYSDVGSILCDMGFAEHENGVGQYPTLCDELDTVGDPFVDAPGGDFHLAAPLAGWPGLDLCESLLTCTADDTYGVDMYGNERGADGVWDRGAVEY